MRQVGWAEIQRGCRPPAAGSVAVVALGGLRFFARAKSWVLCADRSGASGLSPAQAFGAVLAGDAVGNLTPLGLLASEPAKVLLVRGTLATGPALSSVAIDNGFYTASVLVMIAAGAAAARAADLRRPSACARRPGWCLAPSSAPSPVSG
ncbi:MAG: hypothetical protein R2708_15200 [Vicinamibacterales bacterium]